MRKQPCTLSGGGRCAERTRGGADLRSSTRSGVWSGDHGGDVLICDGNQRLSETDCGNFEWLHLSIVNTTKSSAARTFGARSLFDLIWFYFFEFLVLLFSGFICSESGGWSMSGVGCQSFVSTWSTWTQIQWDQWDYPIVEFQWNRRAWRPFWSQLDQLVLFSTGPFLVFYSLQFKVSRRSQRKREWRRERQGNCACSSAHFLPESKCDYFKKRYERY